MKFLHNAGRARDSFVTRKAEQKMDVLADIYKSAAGNHFVDEQRDTLQRTLYFEGFRYLDHLRLVYHWENRFLSVNYNLQTLSDIRVNDRFDETGGCRFEMRFGAMRRENDCFICRDWRGGDDGRHDAYLERLNHPLILDRIHRLDICRAVITHKPEWGYFRVGIESMIGSGTWLFIPPVMQLIAPRGDECVRFMELFELLGDALVNNRVGPG